MIFREAKISDKELKLKESNANFITDLVGPENEYMQIAHEKMKYESSDLITYYKMIERIDK